MVTYIRSDLDFILEQIKIAEAHAVRSAIVWSGRACPNLQPLPGACARSTAPTTTCSTKSGARPTTSSPSCWTQSSGLRSLAIRPPGTRDELQPVKQPQLGCLRLEPAHHFQPARRPDAGQSLRHPDSAAARRLCGSDGRPRCRHTVYEAFKPAFDAEYQARVVMQNAKIAADELGDGDPLTPPTPAEQTASTPWQRRPQPTPLP